MDIKRIEVKESILSNNDMISDKTNDKLTSSGVFAINVMGAPGVGKTSTITSIIEKLEDIKAYVLEGDIESDIDARKMAELGIETIQINTHGACHLDAPTIADAIDNFDSHIKGVLFIENIGNLVCPAEFNIGEHVKMLIVTCTDGSDKPYKYPLAFEKADIIILNKSDLLPYVDFDEKFFMDGIRLLNKNVPVFKVSARENTGYEEVVIWIKDTKAKLAI